MELFVFAGPTLSHQDGRAELDAHYLPPVSQGDIYSLARRRPWGIGIIDGYFERMPAVWHKEILWAMSQGVRVFGAASMGALRAAELERFGMEGVGRIFEAFRAEELEDDDEVAVIHGPAETGYCGLSEAMVNIRFTLVAAERAGIIGQATHQALIGIAKALFYADRAYPAILARAAAQGRSTAELDRLSGWLTENAVDQKRADAFAMLRTMRDQWQADHPPKRARFRFHHTDAWEELRREIDGRSLDDAAGAETYRPDAPLDELRLHGAAYREAHEGATLRALALRLADLDGVRIHDDQLRDTVDAFRVRHGLLAPDDTDNWAKDQGLDDSHFAWLMHDEARAGHILALAGAEAKRYLPDQLRLSGQYADLARRARDKQRVLAEHGVDNPGLGDTGLTEEELWRWYFEEHLKVPVPSDPIDHARELGMNGTEALRRLVVREFLYRRLTQNPIAAGTKESGPET